MSLPRLRPFLLFAIMILPMSAALLFTGCQTTEPKLTSMPSEPLAASLGQFAGDSSCQPCHVQEFNLHHASRHAATMREIDGSSGAVPLGPIPHSMYSVQRESGRMKFQRSDKPAITADIRYALGSGKDAVTYIGEFSATDLTEFRMTYLPVQRKWCVTPGQQALSNLALGARHELGMAKKCVLCHAVVTEAKSVAPAKGFLGVGCESCHGPGAAHVAAASSNAKTGKPVSTAMEDMSTWTGSKINAVCSRCHRSIDDIVIDGSDANATARFQGYGLELSKCFKNSGGKLSCITCHDAHSDASTDQRFYEKACLKCHGYGVEVTNRICPVNAKEKCVSCHMPKRPIFPGQRAPIEMADHLIMAYRPKK